MLTTAAQSGVNMPRGGHPDTPVFSGPEHSDLTQPTRAVSVAAHVHHHLHRRGQLAVQRRAVKPAERGKRFEASRNLGGVVGVYRPCAAVVAGLS
ncbi:hypothetical protein C8E89_101512 [Mycolicibacterium moriokaense]|uniref:Uncharacterized protein n=1 Tax=Mycolicibacterium moriokaense TaxID=39691 RepID=A0A318HNB0_9MYCO|nr:hypothetical protein C8E89_101512 [Mycolicibacterium moriokaense]